MEVEITKQLNNNNNNNVPGLFLSKKTASKDLIIIIAILLIVYILLKIFHVSNFISSLYGDSEYKLIELLIIFFVTTIGLIIFTSRRFKENKEDLYEWVDLKNKLNQYEKKFENIVYNVPGIAVFSVGADHSVTYWNQACEKIFGFSNNEAVGKKIEDLIIPTSSLTIFNNTLDKYYDGKIEFHQGEMEYLNKDKSVLNMISSFHKHNTVLGNLELYCLSVDMTELKRTKKELRDSNSKLLSLARTDPLTNLPNRRSILEKIEYEKIKYDRSKEIFSIAMIDLDNFKNINDIYGHECGDFVLKQISSLMIEIVRKQDVVGRYGGEEFILLFPQTNAEGALHITNIIRKQVSKLKIIYKDKELSLTATIGISDYQNEKTLINELIEKADIAMYEGKSQGKNKVVVSK